MFLFVLSLFLLSEDLYKVILLVITKLHKNLFQLQNTYIYLQT